MLEHILLEEEGKLSAMLVNIHMEQNCGLCIESGELLHISKIRKHIRGLWGDLSHNQISRMLLV